MSPAAVSYHRSRHRWNALAAGLLIVVAILALGTLGLPSVERTQEARVLETARQMRVAAVEGGEGVRAFLIPHINGALRLQKPPLAYWLAAGAYSIFGVANEWSGRVPFALCWLGTSAAIFLIGRRLFGGRAAFIATSISIGCVMNARYGTLAETDVLATLFTTLAAYANWCGIGGLQRRDAPPRFTRAAACFHLGAIATACAAMSKGGPAAFPVLFLFALAIARRDWRAIGRWFLSGAPITFILFAGAWYAYVIRTVGYATFLHELQVVTEGGGHRGWFFSYLAYIVIDTAPWSLLTILALGTIATRLRRRSPRLRTADPRLVGLGLWFLTTLVPLCVIGQKQRHYLMPLMPPLVLIVGWYVDRALRGRKHREAIHVALIVTAALAALAAIALPILGRVGRGNWHPLDALIAALMLAIALATGYPLIRSRIVGVSRSTLSLAATAPIVFVAMQLVWIPTTKPLSPRTIAEDVRRTFGPRPIRFVPGEDLPLMFHFRTRAGAGAASGRTLIIQSTRVRSPDPLLPGSVELRSYQDGSDLIRVAETPPARATMPTTNPAADSR